jgi:hypothetical protein
MRIVGLVSLQNGWKKQRKSKGKTQVLRDLCLLNKVPKVTAKKGFCFVKPWQLSAALQVFPSSMQEQ